MKYKTPALWLVILGLIGFADASYLTADHYLTLPLPCTITQGCDQVPRSAWSMVGPIPLAAFGVLYYLTVILLSVYLYTSDTPNPKLANLIFWITVLGVLSSIYFFYLQIAVIHALCQYCLGSALTSVLLLSASWRLKRRLDAPAV